MKFDTKRFSREGFNAKVANADELIRFVKRTDVAAEYRKVMDEQENFNMLEMMNVLDDDVVKQTIEVSNIMADYFGNLTNEQHQLGLFAERYLTSKIVEYVEKDASDSVATLVDNYKTGLISLMGDPETINPEELKEEIRATKARLEADTDLWMNFDKTIQKAKVARILKDRGGAGGSGLGRAAGRGLGVKKEEGAEEEDGEVTDDWSDGPGESSYHDYHLPSTSKGGGKSTLSLKLTTIFKTECLKCIFILFRQVVAQLTRQLLEWQPSQRATTMRTSWPHRHLLIASRLPRMHPRPLQL